MREQSETPLPQHTGGGLTGAIERGEVQKREWKQDGTLLSAPDFAKKLGVSPTGLPKLEERNQLFALIIDKVSWYPSELLKLTREQVTDLRSTLADEPASGRFIFLKRKHGALGGGTVVETAHQGHFDRVLRLAAAWRER
jgi:hypothetical protein